MKKIILCAIILLLCTLCLSGCFDEEKPTSENGTVSSTLSKYALTKNQTTLEKVIEDNVTKAYIAKNWTGNNEDFYIQERYSASYKNTSLVNESGEVYYNSTPPLELDMYLLNSSNQSQHAVDSMKSFIISLGFQGINITNIGADAYLYTGNITTVEGPINYYTVYVSVEEILFTLKGTASSQQKFLSFAEIIEENIVEQKNQTG